MVRCYRLPQGVRIVLKCSKPLENFWQGRDIRIMVFQDDSHYYMEKESYWARVRVALTRVETRNGWI